MRTVLGLSKTSTSIGWVLVDRRDVAGDPLDHDAFDITDASTAAPVATARRVRDIATASGYTVDSVRVTTSGNVSSLRDALTEAGFAHVVSVSLTDATRAWAVGQGRANGHAHTALCILGRDSASLSVIDSASGAVEATTTTSSRDSISLISWLNAAFADTGSPPEVLYLIGSRAQLDAHAGSLDVGLSIPVVATRDAQLALARGATASDIMSFPPVATDASVPVRLVRKDAHRGGHRCGRLAVHAVLRGQPGHSRRAQCSAPRTAAGRSTRGDSANRRAGGAHDAPSATDRCGSTSAMGAAGHIDSRGSTGGGRSRCTEAIPAAAPETVEDHAAGATPSRRAAAPAHTGSADRCGAAPAPPPPPDPLEGVLSPLFGGLP